MRFSAIWVALLVLVIIGAIFLPRSIHASTVQSMLPFAAFLAIASMGQALVIMARGIDLSAPAIVALSSSLLLGITGGSNDLILPGIAVALFGATLVGLINGVFVAVFRLNALIVTLATGAIVGGVTLWYRQGLPAEASVPAALSAFGSRSAMGLNMSVWLALILVVLIATILRKTLIGRRFEAVGANPEAARINGLRVACYQIGAFIAAALLYGIMSILLSAFIRNPTLEIGTPYLLAPIAAAVLGATSVSGGIGSMVAVLGAAIFLTQLGQMLKLVGLAMSYQMIIQGCAIAAGMYLSGLFEPRRKG